MSKEAIVKTTSGKLEGVFENNLYMFRGIPFAKPPVGDLRWAPPKPVKPWDGIREAKRFAAISPQIVMELPMPGGPPPMDPLPQDEDCLFLNIWTPGLDNAKRPVLFWIHGGAFIIGSGCDPLIDTGLLCHRGDLVIVSVNYRLGALGYMNLKEITDGKVLATGNEGMLDQVVALDWVLANIAEFGGDPENITVSGFSAGGMSTGNLLAMPSARGKFQKAINRSGSGNVVGTLESAAVMSEKYLSILGVSPNDIDGLLNVSTDRILAAQNELQIKTREEEYRGTPFQPVMDGDVVPEWPLVALRDGFASDIPVIAGTSRDELKAFSAMDPTLKNLTEDDLLRRLTFFTNSDFAPRLIDVYRSAIQKRGSDGHPLEVYGTITTDYLFRVPTLSLAQYQHENDAPAFNYLFTHESPAMGGIFGAMHGLDNPFLFGGLNAEFSGDGPKEQELATKIQDSTIEFTRTGNPSCDTIGEWPEYGQERQTMVLEGETRVESRLYEEERAVWDEYNLIHSYPL